MATRRRTEQLVLLATASSPEKFLRVKRWLVAWASSPPQFSINVLSKLIRIGVSCMSWETCRVRSAASSRSATLSRKLTRKSTTCNIRPSYRRQLLTPLRSRPGRALPVIHSRTTSTKTMLSRARITPVTIDYLILIQKHLFIQV